LWEGRNLRFRGGASFPIQPQFPMKNLIVAISGASGAIYGKRILEVLQKNEEWKTHLIYSNASAITVKQELNEDIKNFAKIADFNYPYKDISACISSGSFKTDGMIIAPCSIRTMSAIANGITDNLITRSADVVLKERRRLVILLRETPLHSIHLENMKRLSDAGAVIMPPVPAFYTNPKTIDDIVNHSVGRALEFFNIDLGLVESWKGIK
jgi:polyprenyl P-hydroxybenzoate/phenylacrylic acid decarboxylase-like protein